MKNIFFYLILASFVLTNCSDNNREDVIIEQPHTTSYEKSLNNLGIQLNTNYSYKNVTGDVVGQIKFNSNQTVTEVYNGTVATFEYKFESNNQAGNDLTLTFTAIDKSAIPSYSPKMPVTSLAKNYYFQISKRNYNGALKIQIGGMYSVADPSEYWKLIVQ